MSPNIFKTAKAAEEKSSQPRWTKREEIDLARYISEGKTSEEIASLMGRTFSSIQNKRYHSTMRKPIARATSSTIADKTKKKWRSTDDRVLRSMIKNDRTGEQISAALNRSVASITSRKYQLGIRKRIAHSSRKDKATPPVSPSVSRSSMMVNLNKAISEARSMGMKLSVTIESE